jgi:hypothetical protein
MTQAAQRRLNFQQENAADGLFRAFSEWCRPKIHWYPTLSAEKSGKDGARKSTAKAKML